MLLLFALQLLALCPDRRWGLGALIFAIGWELGEWNAETRPPIPAVDEAVTLWLDRWVPRWLRRRARPSPPIGG
jgi:hypothetical protein